MAESKFYALIPQTTTHSKQLNALSYSTRWLYVVMVAERGGLRKPFRFPYKKMEEVTGMNSSTIRRGIISLVDGGFLSYDHGGLERNPNLYNLNDVWL